MKWSNVVPAKPSITDPDVQVLAAVATALLPDYSPPDDDPWEGSPFQWILSQPSRTKGAIGEALVAGWSAAKGFNVVRSPDSEADRIIEGHRIEIKFSTLWRLGGYKFQQIREQDYEYCFCLGLSPFDAHAWLLPKDILREYVIGHMGQHTGASGSDTAWLGFQADEPYKWMSPYGGRLADVAKLITKNGKGLHAGGR
jgi:hypothetical protein